MAAALPVAPDTDEIDADDLLIAASVYRERYLDGQAARLVEALASVEADAYPRFLARVERLTRADLTRFLRARDLRGTERLRLLQVEMQGLAKAYRAKTSEHIEETARDLVPVEMDFQREYLESAGVATSAVTIGAVLAAVRAEPILGRHLRDYAADQERNVGRTVATTLRDGLSNGLPTAEVVTALFGTAALARRNGALRTHREGAAGLLRTVAAHQRTVASDRVMAAAGVDEVIWTSTLDSRTTFLCMSRDGRTYPRGSVSVPAHFRCRSVLRPYTGIGGGSRASRGSSGGKPVPMTTFGPWLRRQSPAFIAEALGSPTKAKLFLQGGLKIEKFADITTGRPLTIKELRSRHRDLFRRLAL